MGLLLLGIATALFLMVSPRPARRKA